MYLQGLSPASFVPALDSQKWVGKNLGVSAPVTQMPGDSPVKKTLGDVLYADRAKTRVSEAEWFGLVQAVARRDQRSLHSLYGRMHQIVFTLVVRIVMNRETAEEVTLDVFHD